AVDDIYYDMDMDHAADISSDEMLAWSKRGNNIVDRLADIIDQEVYQIWLSESKKRSKNMRRSSESWPEGQHGAFNPQEAGMIGSPNGTMHGTGSPMHSEYGPAPSYSSGSPQGQDQSGGWFGGFFDGQESPASRSPMSGPPTAQTAPPSAPLPPSPPADLHDPFAQPRRGAVPPPPPPPAPGRASPVGSAGAYPNYPNGFASYPAVQPAYNTSHYSHPSPCRSSPQYTGRY
ncbi:Hypothetical protein SCF082_LOCUS16728, partial [Durusdinium trenchii]